MQAPTHDDMTALKRIGRYLLHRKRLIYVYRAQEEPTTWEVYCDTDHAGCLETRKSTTGYALFHGNHCLKTGSNTQQAVSLSSGESEFYGAIKAASVGLGCKSMGEDVNLQREVVLRLDSSAAKAICERRGVGRVRHIATRYLWIQQRVEQRELRLVKEPTATNVADLMTKTLPADRVEQLLTRMGLFFCEGRHELAPQLIGAGGLPGADELAGARVTA